MGDQFLIPLAPQEDDVHQLCLRMLLRMLSACAPGIGYLINPIACSGQDQDPSNETIVAARILELGVTFF